MLTTLLLAVAAQAAPPSPTVAPEPEKKVIREVIIVDGKDKRVVSVPKDGMKRREIMIINEDGPAKAGERRHVHVHRHGAGEGRMVMVRNCEDGQKFETGAEADKDGKKVRTEVKLCHKGKRDPAAMVEGLERASKRIAENKEMPEEVRARVLASLSAEIARLKAAKP